MGIDRGAWLITGGCGFIGTSLIKRLIVDDSEARIRVLDNLSVGTRDDLSGVTSFVEKSPTELNGGPKEVELVEGDIRDYDSCLKCSEGMDVIVHLAANTGVAPSVADPRLDMESNVVGTFNLLEAARMNHVERFVFASSGAPVGEVEPPLHEEKAPKPVSPYGASKLAGEGYCSTYYRTFGIRTVSLRFGNVYGPLSKHKNSVVAKFFKQALSGETLEIYGDGSQTRDFLYIDDLVEAILAASRTEVCGEVFQIATHMETTVNEIAEMIKKIVETKTDRKVKLVHGETRKGDVKRNFSDISKAKKVLGWEPRVKLRAGLEETWVWFDANWKSGKLP